MELKNCYCLVCGSVWKDENIPEGGNQTCCCPSCTSPREVNEEVD